MQNYRAGKQPTALSAMLSYTDGNGFSVMKYEVLAGFTDFQSLKTAVTAVLTRFGEDAGVDLFLRNSKSISAESGPSSPVSYLTLRYTTYNDVKYTVYIRFYEYGFTSSDQQQTYNWLKSLER